MKHFTAFFKPKLLSFHSGRKLFLAFCVLAWNLWKLFSFIFNGFSLLSEVSKPWLITIDGATNNQLWIKFSFIQEFRMRVQPFKIYNKSLKSIFALGFSLILAIGSPHSLQLRFITLSTHGQIGNLMFSFGQSRRSLKRNCFGKWYQVTQMRQLFSTFSRIFPVGM